MRVVDELVDVEGQICLAEIGTMENTGMPPVAVDDMITATGTDPETFDPSANDTDADGDEDAGPDVDFDV